MPPSEELIEKKEETISSENTAERESAKVETESAASGAPESVAPSGGTSCTETGSTLIESKETIPAQVLLSEYAYCEDGQIMRNAAGTTVYSVRKQGRAHVLTGKVCQDFYANERIDEETLVLTVADGHGGSDYVKSDVGARLACQTFIDIVRSIRYRLYRPEYDGDSLSDVLQTPEFKDTFLKAWQSAVLRDYARDTSEELPQSAVVRRYGTTFLFAVMTRDAYILGQLGDGAVFLFNRQGQGQLFKRHSPKLDSTTSSLSSSRAKYAFVINAYDRGSFPAVLLSTDGIYDKLDAGDSFQVYASQLLQQAERHRSLPHPFSFGKYDISAISTDDCTVTFALSKQEGRAFAPSFPEGIFTQPARFERFCDPIEIYRNTWNGTEVEIHAVGAAWYQGAPEKDTVLRYARILLPLAVVSLPGDRRSFFYSSRPELFRMSELIEHGEHLEKRYPWNRKDEVEEEDAHTSAFFASNLFWLKVYESVLALKKELEEKELYVLPSFFEQAFVSEQGDLYICSDALCSASVVSSADAEGSDNVTVSWEKQDGIFQRWFDCFSIMGKLSYGEVSIPLFRCPQSGRNRGQKICLLDPPDSTEPLCRVVFNERKNIYALWNISGRLWELESETNKTIAPNAVLRLESNSRFFLGSPAQAASAGEAKSDATSSRKPCEKYYHVTLFETEMADVREEESRLEER